MRKLFVFNLVSLDGFFAGPDGELDWHNVDAEFNEYAISMLDSVDTLLFGRVTYDLMAGYWPTPEGVKDDPLVAQRMNDLSKVVFSRTMDKAGWRNTRLVMDNIVDEIKNLKKQSGKDMVILSSGTIVSQFAQSGLIDEYRFMVNPIVLGSGKPMFQDLKDRLPLKLLKTWTFRSGNVLLTYKPSAKQK
jgi:dihydrofolate reductase